MKDILVHVDNSRAGAARVETAIALAGMFGAKLTGLHVTPEVDISPGLPLAQVDALLEGAGETLTREARHAKELFRTSVDAAGVAHAYLSAGGDVPTHIAQAARYADLVVVGQYEHQGSAIHHPLPICHAVSVRCGRPVLVFPARSERIERLSRALIAWDGSREAVRAVHDALPLLARADEVRIVVAKPAAERVPAEVQHPDRLSEHLARHGVQITSWDRVDDGRSAADAIHAHLGRSRFDLVVMGAYSHPQWYEFLVGGVTQSLLLTASVPMLISH